MMIITIFRLSALLLAGAGLCSSSSSDDNRRGRGTIADLEARADSNCTDVHIFLARGNNEPYPGRQGKLVAAICNGLSSCDYEDLIYSALYTDLYCQTVYDGVNAGFNQMTAYAAKCPDSKLILSGYSQGAQIVTDILGGAGGTLYNGCVQPSHNALDPNTSPGNQLAAIISFGNVRHTASQSYNFGSGSKFNSQFPRTSAQLTTLNQWKSKLRDWCRSTDPVCATSSSSTNVADHLSYFDTLSDEGADWVKSVASIKDDTSTSVASIPTSISGTAQNYNTIGSGTPTGTVILATSTTTARTTGRSSSTTASRGTSSVPSSTGTVQSGTSAQSTSAGSSATSATESAAASTPSSGANARYTASSMGIIGLLLIGIITW